MNVPLHIIRSQEIYLSTSKVAEFMQKSTRWVVQHKADFGVVIRKNNKRNLQFELTNVLKVWKKLNPEEN